MTKLDRATVHALLLLLLTSVPAVHSGCRAADPRPVAGADARVFDTVPSLRFVGLVSDKYEPNKLVTTANGLRALGKPGAVRVLRAYLNAEWPPDLRRDQDVQILCRVLFENPEGWKPPALGAPHPQLASDTSRFPLFPVAMSNGVPFLLVQGYSVGGGGMRSHLTLEQCERLELLKEDLRPCSRGEAMAAADALISTEAFKAIGGDAGRTRAQAKLVQD
jgi:hypothetical protein